MNTTCQPFATINKRTSTRRWLLRVLMMIFTKPKKCHQAPSKLVAIVVPLSDRKRFTADEEISIRHLTHHLFSYDKYLISPEGVDVKREGFKIKKFRSRFFGSAAAHAKLLSFPEFYRKFIDYEYILFYHLDSLVFSDKLTEWCGSGLDYIGPPWIKCNDSPWVQRERVGNGGFCLLRVESAIMALTNRYHINPTIFWFDIYSSYSPRLLISWMKRLDEIFPNFWPLSRLLQEWKETENPSEHNRNNDIFWSDMASNYFPDFKVASLEQGLRFAFEVSPKTCFKMNSGKMPFGCHAWTKYDRSVWDACIISSHCTS